MELTTEELNSALWKKLRAHYETKLNTLRKSNDHLKDMDETTFVRGRISAHKELLKLDPDWKE